MPVNKFTGDNLRRHVFFEDSLCAAVTHVLWRRKGWVVCTTPPARHVSRSTAATLTFRELTPLRTTRLWWSNDVI